MAHLWTTVALNIRTGVEAESPTTRLCGGFTGLLRSSYYDAPKISMGRHSLVPDTDLNFESQYQSGYEHNSNIDIQSVCLISISVQAQFHMLKALIPKVH